MAAQNITFIQNRPAVEETLPLRGLPAKPLLFVNRFLEKQYVKKEFTARNATSPVMMVSGRSGMGASTFALNWGHSYADDLYPDGTLYADLREDRAEGGTALSAVLAKLLIRCGCDVPRDLTSRRERYRKYLEDKRVLVILDHVENQAELEALRPAAAGSALLATCSYKGDFVTGQQDLSLEPFGSESAAQLLAELLVEDERLSEAEPDIAALIELCEGMPFLLCMAVGPMKRDRHVSLSEVVTWLREEIDQGGTASDTESILDAVAGDAYSSLSDDAARLYRALGCHPGLDVAKEAIDTLLKRSGARGSKVSKELCDRYLLDRHGQRYRLPSLIRAHALAQARNADDDTEDSALLMWADWYVNCAQAADRAFIKSRNRVFDQEGPTPKSFDSDEDGKAWLDAERHNLLALQQRLYERGQFRPVMQLGEAMWALYVGARYLEDWLVSSQLSLDAAVAANDVVAEVRFRAFLARALMDNASNTPEPGRTYEKARHELDLAEGRRVLGRGLDYRASAIEFKGRLLSYQGHYLEAIADYRRAMELFAQRAADPGAPEHERRANRRGVALQHQFIGRAWLDHGEYAEAAESLREAESRLVDIGDHYRDVAKIRTEIGEALRHQGDVLAAYQVLSQAVEALRGRSWQRVESDALWQLSFVVKELEMPELERTCLDRLRDLYSATGNPRFDEVVARLAALTG